LAFALATDAATHGSSTEGGVASLQDKLHALEQRAFCLERLAGGDHIDNRVVAPFEIVDGVRRRIFYVDPVGAVHIYAHKGEAVISAGAGGGNFDVVSGSGSLEARLSALVGGIQVSENHQDRITLGKDPKQGNYRLKFLSGSDKDLAGIGEDTKTHSD
jgi:hypothetical protein